MFEYKELSHLSKLERKSLVREARYAAFNKLKLGRQAVGYFILSLVIGLFVGATSYVFFGGYAASGFGALAAIWSYQIFISSLISKGLEYVLSKNS